MADFSGDIPAVETEQTTHTNGYVDFTKMAAENFHTPESIEADAALLTQGAYDDGNAVCVNLRYAGKFLHNKSFGWMYYTNTHWKREGADAVLGAAVTETLHARLAAAVNTGTADRYKNILEKCIPNSGKVNGAIQLLSYKTSVEPSEFNQNIHLLNCLNGVVDLRTGAVLTHEPGQRFTYCTATEYHKDASQTYWRNWLTDAVGTEAADWLQMAVGYSITGSTKEEILFYLFGPPRSGKGTFTETLLTLLGTPLGEAISFDILTAQRDVDTQNFRLAPLHSSRFVAASESNQYERFNEAKLKTLTGGDSIQCAFKHRDPFAYRPQFKIWLSSNQPVNADPDDDATWGRLRVVHFPHSHLGEENKNLKELMRSPDILEGILAWAVDGSIRWHKLGDAGLPALAIGEEMKSQHRADLDNVSAWIEECCKKIDGQFYPGSNLYLSYETWCKANGIEPKKHKGFSVSLKHKGFIDTRDTVNGKQVRGFKGLQLT